MPPPLPDQASPYPPLSAHTARHCGILSYVGWYATLVTRYSLLVTQFGGWDGPARRGDSLPERSEGGRRRDATRGRGQGGGRGSVQGWSVQLHRGDVSRGPAHRRPH